ncbi:unnamed protein product [Blepharisma stoltei]|uniref:Uncharacterized protein n=1 Tax=Blepharisma stoltei TaxID=1481888 RepID=A0AAU9IHA1_9CILI|nr:unnamed protein product [Blepharisma stoltei]
MLNMNNQVLSIQLSSILAYFRFNFRFLDSGFTVKWLFVKFKLKPRALLLPLIWNRIFLQRFFESKVRYKSRKQNSLSTFHLLPSTVFCDRGRILRELLQAQA